MRFLTFLLFKSSIWCLEYMETIGFHFESQTGQIDPVEGIKQLHRACHFDCKEGRNKKKDNSLVGLNLTFP